MAGGVDAEQFPRPIGAELLADQGEDARRGDALSRAERVQISRPQDAQLTLTIHSLKS